MNHSHLSLVIDNTKGIRSKENSKYIISLKIECYVCSENIEKSTEIVEDRMYKYRNTIRKIVNGDFSYYIENAEQNETEVPQTKGMNDFLIETTIEYIKKKTEGYVLDMIKEIEQIRDKIEQIRDKLETLLSG